MQHLKQSFWQALLWVLFACAISIFPGDSVATQLQQSGDVEAGPIWNNDDAKIKCPSVCSNVGATWNGNWTTTEWNVMSVCGCNVTCASDEICKSFDEFKEYNDHGNKANGVCEPWLQQKNCAKGIPKDALADYEIVIRSNRVYYKSDNQRFNSWSGGNRETLYVIDARDDKVYFVNVDGRYIEVRGGANCVGQTVAQGQSTSSCPVPRLTTHAGILMGSVAGLPNQSAATPHQEKMIKVKGAGTVEVVNGFIKKITNDSGHFQPTKDNLKTAMAILSRMGVFLFPHEGGACPYDFKPVKDQAGNIKPGVFSQENIAGTHCEL